MDNSQQPYNFLRSDQQIMERVNSLKRKYNEQRRKPTMIDFPLLYTKAQKIIDLKETEVRSETSKHATIHRQFDYLSNTQDKDQSNVVGKYSKTQKNTPSKPKAESLKKITISKSNLDKKISLSENHTKTQQSIAKQNTLAMKLENKKKKSDFLFQDYDSERVQAHVSNIRIQKNNRSESQSRKSKPIKIDTNRSKMKEYLKIYNTPLGTSIKIKPKVEQILKNEKRVPKGFFQDIPPIVLALTESASSQHLQVKSSRQSDKSTKRSADKRTGLDIDKQISRQLKKQTQEKPLRQQSPELMLSEYLDSNNLQFLVQSSRLSRKPKIQPIDYDKCKQIAQIFKKVTIVQTQILRQPNKLDWTEMYITNEKQQYEQRMFASFDPLLRRIVIKFVILCRFIIFTLANLVLLEFDGKQLSSILNKQLQGQISLCYLLEHHNSILRRRSLKNTPRDNSSQQPSKQLQAMAIETRSNVIERINKGIYKELTHFLARKELPHKDLVCKLLELSMNDLSFDQLLFVDRTLKWEILGIPTSPFLPNCNHKSKYYLILDLDQTLIHFNPSNETLHIRPFTEQFLQKAALQFQITIFTAATKEYAEQILNEIDQRNFITHRLYRNHLTYINGESIKDISLLGRDLKRTLIVDNIGANFRMHVENGIAIQSWYGKDDDQILSKLSILLTKIIEFNPEDLRYGVKNYQKFIREEIQGQTM